MEGGGEDIFFLFGFGGRRQGRKEEEGAFVRPRDEKHKKAQTIKHHAFTRAFL
jgi:hypothetical protein